MIVVTGGAGFIGSVMIWQLNQLGRDDIVVVDDVSDEKSMGNACDHLNELNFEDYLDPQDFLSRLDQIHQQNSIEAIVHLGACSATTETDASFLYRNNYLYTKQLAEWSIEHNARFIYASSGSTYGDGRLGYSDDHAQTHQFKPLNLYGRSKHLFDRWALKSGAINHIVGLKFFNVFGPHEYHKGKMASVVLHAFKQIQETGKVKLFKSYREDYAHGEQKRDFVYVKDCTSVMQWLLENPDVNGLFNLGTGNARSWNDLAHAVFKAMNLPATIEYIEMPDSLRSHYQYFTQAEMQKLRDAGYSQHISSLEEGVQDYVQQYLMKEYGYLSVDIPKRLVG